MSDIDDIAILNKAFYLACNDAADGCCPHEMFDYICKDCDTCSNRLGNREDVAIDIKCWQNYYIQKAKEFLAGQILMLKINEDFIKNKYGYCFYIIDDNEPALIFNLYIEPEYRRQGHAKHLIQLVIDEIKKTGYKGQIHIEACPQENSININSLISFYEKMGLTVINKDYCPICGKTDYKNVEGKPVCVKCGSIVTEEEIATDIKARFDELKKG